jgi:hypothetical protein
LLSGGHGRCVAARIFSSHVTLFLSALVYRAVSYVLMAIRRPDVTGLRVEGLKVAAMDHLFRPVLELKHHMPESYWAGLEDFLLHFPYLVQLPY